MAYFSNGTEGMIFEENVCSRCVNYDDRNCALLALHWLYNGDQHPEHEKDAQKAAVKTRTREILSLLIADDFDEENGVSGYDCKMFRSKVEMDAPYRTHEDRELLPL